MSDLSIHLRFAGIGDLDELMLVEHLAFEKDRLSRRTFQYHLRAENSQVIVAVIGDEIVGYVLLRHLKKTTHLRALASLRRGAGRLLLQEAEFLAVYAGSDSIRLEVRKDNTRARHLYVLNGYEYYGEKLGHYKDDGASGFRYRKMLNVPTVAGIGNQAAQIDFG